MLKQQLFRGEAQTRDAARETYMCVCVSVRLCVCVSVCFCICVSIYVCVYVPVSATRARAVTDVPCRHRFWRRLRRDSCRPWHGGATTYRWSVHTYGGVALERTHTKRCVKIRAASEVFRTRRCYCTVHPEPDRGRSYM